MKKDQRWASSFMLPEFVEALQKRYDGTDRAEEKPILADQKFQEIDKSIRLSLHENLDVNVTYYDHVSRTKKSFLGEVRHVDPINHKIKFMTNEGQVVLLCTAHIIDVCLN